MHPESISYRGADYALAHLKQSFGKFAWTPKNEAAVSFSMRVRYSDHCYSREIKAPDAQAVDDFVVGQTPLRVFCTDRHHYTPDLVNLINGLFAKPGTSVALTSANRNWHIFQLYTQPPPGGGTHRYCVFFNVKKELDALGDGTLPLDLFVESAYVRDNTVDVIKKIPFGKVAELTWKGERYF